MRLPAVDRDQMFLLFTGALFAVMVLFGAGAFVVSFWGSQSLGLRMVNVFAAMFSGVLGLGTGYLLGASVGAARRDR